MLFRSLIAEILPQEVIRVQIEKDLERGFDYRRIILKDPMNCLQMNLPAG